MKMLYIFPFLGKFPQYMVLTISKYGLESSGLSDSTGLWCPTKIWLVVHMESIWNTRGTDKTLKYDQALIAFGFQLTAWTDTAGLTNQLCRIYNNNIQFLACTDITAVSLISSVGFLFNISAWTDTTAASQISPEGFVSIYSLNWHNSKAFLTSCRFYKQQRWVIKLNTWTDLVFVQRVEQNGLR